MEEHRLRVATPKKNNTALSSVPESMGLREHIMAF